MSIKIDLSQQAAALKTSAKTHRLKVTIWIKNKEEPCPFEYNETGTTKEGYLLEEVALILEDVMRQLNEGKGTVELLPKK